MDEKDIDRLFTYHEATHVSLSKFEAIRSAAKILGNVIIQVGGSQAEVELAITKLRECVYFSIASLAVPTKEDYEAKN